MITICLNGSNANDIVSHITDIATCCCWLISDDKMYTVVLFYEIAICLKVANTNDLVSHITDIATRCCWLISNDNKWTIVMVIIKQRFDVVIATFLNDTITIVIVFLSFCFCTCWAHYIYCYKCFVSGHLGCLCSPLFMLLILNHPSVAHMCSIHKCS